MDASDLVLVCGLLTMFVVLLSLLTVVILAPSPHRYKRCMVNIARMEIECYGLIVSQSVEWWLTDTKTVLCLAHPEPELPLMVLGHRCTCPPKPKPPEGPGSASHHHAVMMMAKTGKLPPPNPGLNVKPCTTSCPWDRITSGDGQIVKYYCTQHGREHKPGHTGRGICDACEHEQGTTVR